MESGQDGIRRTFVDAYPRYVASVLAAREIDIDEVVADAIIEGAEVLDELLTVFEATSLVDQSVSPLELFREALRPVDRALALVDAPRPSLAAGATRIAPWDRYALSPGSSQVLGRRAQEAHIAWGLNKRQALARYVDSTQGPTVGLLCPNGDLGTLVGEAEALHFRTVALPSEREVSVAVVCADEPGADAVVRSLSARAKVIVYGRSIDDLDQIRFTSLGAASVAEADRLIGHLAEYLPVIS